MGWYQGAFLLSASFGPALGGLAAENWGYQAPFWIYALLSGISAVWTHWGLREDQGGRESAGAVAETIWLGKAENRWGSGAIDQGIRSAVRRLSSVFRLLTRPGFVLIVLVTFSAAFARNGARGTIVPLLGSLKLGLSEGQIGLALTLDTVVNMLTLFVAGPLADRYGRNAVIVPSTIVMAVGLMLFGLGSTITWFFFSACILGVGEGISRLAPAAYASDLTSTGQYGHTLGLFLGPVMSGWIMDQTEASIPLYIAAFILVLVSLIFAAFAPESTRSISQRLRPG